MYGVSPRMMTVSKSVSVSCVFVGVSAGVSMSGPVCVSVVSPWACPCACLSVYSSVCLCACGCVPACVYRRVCNILEQRKLKPASNYTD